MIFALRLTLAALKLAIGLTLALAAFIVWATMLLVRGSVYAWYAIELAWVRRQRSRLRAERAKAVVQRH